jgi:hypothetical protein
MEELGNGAFGSADLLESFLVFMLGVVVLRTSKDHEAAIRVGEAAPILGRHSLIFGSLLIMIPTLRFLG